MQRTLDLYENPYVVISFMTEDLDRSILSVRTGQKPRFTLDADGAPTLADTPIEPSFEAFLQENPPRIPSYLYRLLLYSRLTPKALRSTLRGEDEIVASKIALNRAILTQMVAEVRSRQLEFCVLVFHPHIPGVSTLGGPPDWREVFLRELLADLGVDLIWSEDLLPAGGALDPSLYILADDGHPTTLFNRLIAGAMKEHVLR